MAILTFPKHSDDPVSEHFNAGEFICPCRECKEALIDEDLIAGLERIRVACGVPIKITSGYRCAVRQKELEELGYETGKRSTHLEGRAADLWTGHHTGLQLEEFARAAGFEAVGVGRVFIHVDTRRGKKRRWTYR